MKKDRLIFYAIFAVFHLFIFGFTMYMDSQKSNYNFLFSMLNKIWMLKYGSLIGLILLVVDVIWLMRGEKQHAAEKMQLQNELTNLKAKLFDLQENAKKNAPPRLPE